MPRDENEDEVPRVTWTYRIVRWILGTVLAIFFQEIDVVGKECVPSSGPVIFVGNHPNQFVDGMMMFTQSPRDVFLLIAASSITKYAVQGFFARLQHAIPVYRREDNLFTVKNKITLKFDDEWSATLDKEGPNFDGHKIKPGDILSIPLKKDIMQEEKKFDDVKVLVQTILSSRFAKVTLAPESRAITEELLSLGEIESNSFKVLPKLDQSKAYEAIFSVLSRGDCVGVFPEGGSSDWTELRKLKVGVAYIALSLKKKYGDLPVTIVPCGLNYISGHRFRSKSLIEFGSPLAISTILVEKFVNGDKSAVELLTDQINSRLRDVTLNIPRCISSMLDINQFEAREIITTARRLYQPPSVKLTVAQYLELNRRFANGISKMSEEPKIVPLLEAIRQYNVDLKKLYLSDRQLENSPKNWTLALWGIWSLCKQIVVLLPFILTIPGLLLHLPIAILTKYKALSVASQSAAKSDVKIEGRDVIASTKIALGFIFLLVFYLLYGIIAGLLFGWIWVPVAIIGIPVYTYQCIKYFDMAMVTIRAMIPLTKFLISSDYRKKCKELVNRRRVLREKVREGVKEFGPRFNEYWEQRVVPDNVLEQDDSRTDEIPFNPLHKSYEQMGNTKDMFEGLADDLFDSDPHSSDLL